ncbi:class I SAM-dependent methyltransferase [Patescibacteria group bacterium]|nr:class I SAM-dependent methyltransferase [Patescibacteria group bacterium]
MQNRIREAMLEARSLLARREMGERIAEFDVRGTLYGLAREVAPEARDADLLLMQRWIRPRLNETVADLAAGTGFLTAALTSWTKGSIIAIDPSWKQLQHIERAIPTVKTITMGSDDESLLEYVAPDSFDLVTSFGGLHHARDHKQLMRNIDEMLKPGGRCIVGDIEKGSALAKHFDEVVAKKCLTGHEGITWWSSESIEQLIKGTRLRLVRSELVKEHIWKFDSEKQMAMFFQALHAYDLSHAEIVADLKEALGVWEADGKVCLSWPMFLFELIKI